jgi:hypothetical protein
MMDLNHSLHISLTAPIRINAPVPIRLNAGLVDTTEAKKIIMNQSHIDLGPNRGNQNRSDQSGSNQIHQLKILHDLPIKNKIAWKHI